MDMGYLVRVMGDDDRYSGRFSALNKMRCKKRVSRYGWSLERGGRSDGGLTSTVDENLGWIPRGRKEEGEDGLSLDENQFQ
jgi:hypothetical protein